MVLLSRRLALRAILVGGAVLLPELFPGGAVAESVSTGEIKTIIFVCLHGSVNSQMAAAYFNKAAEERRLPYIAMSRGVDVHRSVPVRILDGLALDGLVPTNSPQELTVAERSEQNCRVRCGPKGTQGRCERNLLVGRAVGHQRLRSSARGDCPAHR